MAVFRVCLSTGLGRLHLVQSVVALLHAGVDVSVIQGWVPSDAAMRWAVPVAARLLRHRGLAAGMAKRRPADLRGRIRGCGLAEFLTQGLFFASRVSRGALTHARAARWGWWAFGRQSRRYLKKYAIFHVRSGAGQGGAIAKARHRGMRILVDQSALHPGFLARQLFADFERHGLPLHMSPDSPFWRLVLKDCEQCDLLLVNSNFVRDTFAAAGYPFEKVRVVTQGVRQDFMGLKHDYDRHKPLRLLFTGNFGILKGAEYLLEALRLLAAAGCQYEMTVVGTHAEADRLLRQRPVSGLRCIGHVPQDALKEYLATADIYVFPSLGEGCASSGMEAMAAGLPVIATYESGLPIADGQTGLIVPPKSGEAIAARIMELARRPDLAESLGRAAARTIRQEFSWEHYTTKVKEVYAEMLGMQEFPAVVSGWADGG